MEIKGLNFVCTCNTCPEQYEVYMGGVHIGHVKLRWGKLACRVPSEIGELIYSHKFKDKQMGCFEDDSQREKYLGIIAKEIKMFYWR